MLIYWLFVAAMISIICSSFASVFLSVRADNRRNRLIAEYLETRLGFRETKRGVHTPGEGKLGTPPFGGSAAIRPHTPPDRSHGPAPVLRPNR